jgi:peroxiredoxin
MRHLPWIITALLILSCSRGEQVRISGVVEKGTGMIYLDEQGIGELRKVDSARIRRNGSFVLKDRISLPAFYNLHRGDDRIIPLLLLPGERAGIRTEANNFTTAYELSGSPESRYLQELNLQLSRTRRSLDSVDILRDQMQDPGVERDSILLAYENIIRKQRRYSIQFVLEHMNSMAAVYALYQKFDDDNYILGTKRDIQLLKITGMALDTLYPGSEYVKSLRQDADKLEQELNYRGWQNLMESMPISFPEIRLPDPDGDTIALSSLRGNVIILSFWASWNQESVALNQDLKRMYSKYHDRGLEIYQVSFDDDPDRWSAAITYDELPWINVSELSYPESMVASLYNVSDLPTYFLIERSGEIAGKNFDRVALDRKIAELIN